MITVVALARRDPTLTQQEFERRWVHDHAVGTRYDGLVDYQIGIGADDPSTPYDGIALMTFTDEESFAAASASDEGKVRRADANTFCSHLEFFVVQLNHIDVGAGA